MKRRTAPSENRSARFGAGLVGALVVVLLAACSGGGSTPTGAGGASSNGTTAPGSSTTASQPQQMRPIKVAYAFISAETLPIWVAQDEKLFEKNGLRSRPSRSKRAPRWRQR